jgi:hypothetical protein
MCQKASCYVGHFIPHSLGNLVPTICAVLACIHVFLGGHHVRFPVGVGRHGMNFIILNLSLTFVWIVGALFTPSTLGYWLFITAAGSSFVAVIIRGLQGPPWKGWA